MVLLSLLGALLIFTASNLDAQCNPEEGGASCQEAPTVCLTNLCDETEVNQPDDPHNGWCGSQTSIQNPQYFVFIPTATSVYFQISVGDCSGGNNALQAALLGTCPWNNNSVLDCNPGTPSGGTIILEASGLVIGQTYWIIFDGSSGSQCEYTIEQANGVYEPVITSELEDVAANPSEVCQGYNGLMLVASPAAEGAHGYWWIPSWAPLDTVTTTDPELSLDVPTNLDPGTYEICVRPFSGCDIGDVEVCIEIEVYEIPPEEREPETFCPEEFPFSWHGVTISGAGEYEASFTDPQGCFYDSLWVVEEYPEVDPGIIDTVYCLPFGENTFYYEGEPYDQAGTYDLLYPGQSVNGCDSVAELNLTLIGIDAFIELSCENGEFVLTPIVQDLIPFNADIEWNWYDGATLLSDESPLNVLEGGTYELYAIITTSSGASCEFLIESFTFVASDYQPDPPDMGFVNTTVCAQEGVFFTVIEDPFGDPLDYVWTGPPNTPIYQDGSATVEFDFSNSSGGEVCVYAINDCGPGPETCFNVDIISLPVAAFTVVDDACTNQTATVTFTGSASVNASFEWNFDNPTSVNGSGAGPYNLTWSLPGDKVITLTIIEPGCDTAMTSDTVTVTSLLAPVINCSSTIDSISFDWDDVAGANCYQVSVNGGPAVPTCNSFFNVNGLSPGDTVGIALTIISGGVCPNILVIDTCIAQDCPAPTILLSGQDSACLNAPALITLSAVVNGVPGIGTWSGQGIVNPAGGVFDPVTAGPGQAQVTFTTNFGGCDFSDTYLITVFDSLTADFTLDPLICISDVANVAYTGNGASGATYTYDFGPATVVTGSGQGPYQLRWATSGLKSVRLQIADQGCVSDLVTRTTNVIAELTPPIVNCSPNTSGMSFTWTIDPASSGFQYTILSGQAGSLNGNTLAFTGLNPGDRVDLEIITQSAGPCPARRDTFTCVARQCPMPVITVVPVADICLYPGTQPVDLQVSIVNGNNGTGGWAGPGVTDLVNGTFDPNVSGAGSHVVSYNYSEDGCDFIESITIHVFDVPDAVISNTSLVITCATNTLILDGTASTGPGISYLWTTPNGVILNGASSSRAEVAAAGNYKLLVSTPDGCKDSAMVTVTLDAGIPTSDAGPDKTLTCNVTTVTLGGNSTTGPNITYAWSTANGNILGPADGQTITANAVGQYDLVVRDVSNGCQATDRVLVLIDTTTAGITLTPGDTLDCNTPISGVTANLTEPVSGYLLTWTTTDGTIVGAANGASVQVSQGGTYLLNIVNTRNGCKRSAAATVAASDEIIDAVNVRVQHVVCHGDNNGALSVLSVSGGVPPYTYSWSSSASSGSSLSNLGPGNYSLTVSDQNGCSWSNTFTVTEPARITVNVGRDTTVRNEDMVMLSIVTNLSAQAIASIDWSDYAGQAIPGNLKITFLATQSATMTATVTDTAGCTGADSMRLTVIVPRIIFIPNVFSPNGDGVNDYFTISGRRNLVNINLLQVFDRWGNQLFERKDLTPGNETQGWDGRFRGDPMQPGTYVYVAQLQYEDGVVEALTGDITILR